MRSPLYLIFGGNGAPVGGAADFLSGHYSEDECRQWLAGHPQEWWQVSVRTDDGLRVVEAGPVVVVEEKSNAFEPKPFEGIEEETEKKVSSRVKRGG